MPHWCFVFNSCSSILPTSQQPTSMTALSSQRLNNWLVRHTANTCHNLKEKKEDKQEIMGKRTMKHVYKRIMWRIWMFDCALHLQEQTPDSTTWFYTRRVKNRPLQTGLAWQLFAKLHQFQFSLICLFIFFNSFWNNSQIYKRDIDQKVGKFL